MVTGAYLLRIPRSSGHPFHEHLTTDSTLIRP
ncbi:pilus assembly protein PilZ, partial [Pseudomonas aeruginosa]|nr:pilus assembly protein PilZ [Pseudomonas aeruginosa]